MIVSIVVCTLDRAHLLRQCLYSLSALSADSHSYEVIIVDNGSKDDTEDVVREFLQKSSHFRFLREDKVGLSHARNLGFRSARAEYVAYFDDDCKIPPEWLTVAQEVIRTRKPAAFGGPYFPFYLTPKPPWFKDEYASCVLSEEARPLNRSEYLTGLNMAIERRVLEHLGGFNPSLGMTGKSVGYAEETDFFQRLRLELPEKEIYYDPRLYVYHLVRDIKMSLRWRVRHYYLLGKYWGRCSLDPAILKTSGSSKALFYHIKELVKDGVNGLFWRDRQRYPYFQNYLLEHSSHYLYGLGICVGRRATPLRLHPGVEDQSGS